MYHHCQASIFNFLEFFLISPGALTLLRSLFLILDAAPSFTTLGGWRVSFFLLFPPPVTVILASSTLMHFFGCLMTLDFLKQRLAHEWGLAYSENGLHWVIWLGCPIEDHFQTLKMFSPVMVMAPKEASFSLWPGGRKPKSRHSLHRRQILGIRVCMCLAVSGEETFSLLYGKNELVSFGSL